jgi:hypothetical protein
VLERRVCGGLLGKQGFRAAESTQQVRAGRRRLALERRACGLPGKHGLRAEHRGAVYLKMQGVGSVLCGGPTQVWVGAHARQLQAGGHVAVVCGEGWFMTHVTAHACESKL